METEMGDATVIPPSFQYPMCGDGIRLSCSRGYLRMTPRGTIWRMKICYVDRNFTAKSAEMIANAEAIITDYRAQGYQLTLRQLYYQFVSRDLIANKQSEYDRLGSVINDARLAGLISWEAIVDLTREMTENSHWSSPRDIVSACATQYQIDKWSDQDTYVEVWIEKDALSGVIEPVCRKLDVPFFSCRGYTSQSSMWGAGRRLMEKAGEDKEVVILHLGDHDPSGIDMTRDIQERLAMFMCEDPEEERRWMSSADDPFEHERLTVRRIALNIDQVRAYHPPPNPAKLTDSRVGSYIKKYGAQSWELDALEPRVLTQLIVDNVMEFRDETLWKAAEKKEKLHRDAITKIVPSLPAS